MVIRVETNFLREGHYCNHCEKKNDLVKDIMVTNELTLTSSLRDFTKYYHIFYFLIW